MSNINNLRSARRNDIDFRYLRRFSPSGHSSMLAILVLQLRVYNTKKELATTRRVILLSFRKEMLFSFRYILLYAMRIQFEFFHTQLLFLFILNSRLVSCL